MYLQLTWKEKQDRVKRPSKWLPVGKLNNDLDALVELKQVRKDLHLDCDHFDTDNNVCLCCGKDITEDLISNLDLNE